MCEPRMGEVLIWFGVDVTPTTGHQRMSAGNTPGDALARKDWCEEQTDHRMGLHWVVVRSGS